MFICEKTTHCCDYEYADKITDIDKDARDCPHLVEVAPVKHGSWISPDGSYYCSECGKENYYAYNKSSGEFTDLYCPNCGAKMDLK